MTAKLKQQYLKEIPKHRRPKILKEIKDDPMPNQIAELDAYWRKYGKKK